MQVQPFSVGDEVTVTVKERAILEKIQQDHGSWIDIMEDVRAFKQLD